VSDKSSIKYILSLSIPIFFANLATPLVGIVDTTLMGNMSNQGYLTATSIASSFFSLVFWSFGFLRMGTVGLVSQSFGRNDYKSILNIVFRNLLFVISISILLILFQKQLLNLCLIFFDLSLDTEKKFNDYFNIRIYSSFFELTIYIVVGLFIGLQKTKISSVAIVLLSILNILFSSILVLKFNLNIKGVAYGTLLATGITSFLFLFYIFYYLRKYVSLNFNIKEIVNTSKLKNLLEINLNIFLRTILLTFSFFWFTYLGGRIGEEFIAANTILINLIFLSAFILDAYAFSTEGIVGYSIGKKNKILFTNIVKNSFILSSLTGILISLFYLFFKNSFIDFMTDIENVRDISYQYSFWLVLLPFVSSFCYQLDGIFIGASQTQELRNAMFISVVIHLISSFMLVEGFGNQGLWISLTIFFILRALTLVIYFNRIYLKI
jgi:MATE family multidrug resistance protein